MQTILWKNIASFFELLALTSLSCKMLQASLKNKQRIEWSNNETYQLK